MIHAQPGETIRLSYKSPARDTTLFPRAYVIDSLTDAQVSGSPVNLSGSAVDGSLYFGSFVVPSAEGVYSVFIRVYTDSGHTTLSDAELDPAEYLDIRRVTPHPTVLSTGAAGFTENDIRDIAKLVIAELEKRMAEMMREHDKKMQAAMAAMKMPDMQPMMAMLQRMMADMRAMPDKMPAMDTLAMEKRMAQAMSVEIRGMAASMASEMAAMRQSMPVVDPGAISRAVGNAIAVELSRLKLPADKSAAMASALERAVKEAATASTSVSTAASALSGVPVTRLSGEMRQLLAALIKFDEIQVQRNRMFLEALQQLLSGYAAAAKEGTTGALRQFQLMTLDKEL